MKEQTGHVADEMAIPSSEHSLWQVEEIQRALREADEDAFESEEKVTAVMNKYDG